MTDRYNLTAARTALVVFRPAWPIGHVCATFPNGIFTASRLTSFAESLFADIPDATAVHLRFVEPDGNGRTVIEWTREGEMMRERFL